MKNTVMNEDLYEMIFKSKSFHLFRHIGDKRISPQELEDILTVYKTFPALDPEIKTDIRMLPAEETTCKRGAEYCMLIVILLFCKKY